MPTIEVTITGTTPLLCNKFTDAAQHSATAGTSTTAVGDRGTPQEQAEAKLYIGHDDKPMIPQPNMYRAIIDAGTFFKAGKSKITTLKTSIIPACLDLGPLEIPIQHKEPWTVDTRAVRIPTTGGRILCHRACFNDWALTFDLGLDSTMLSEKMLRELVDAAGKRIGLGDFRPACKGPFGKFVVTVWKSDGKGEAK